MAAWLSSLESVVRLQSILAWLAIFSAVAAALFGSVSFWLGGRASKLRDQRTEQARDDDAESLSEREELRRQLEQTRQLLDASEERSEKFLDRAEELETDLQKTQENLNRTIDEREAARQELRRLRTQQRAATPAPQPSSAPAPVTDAGATISDDLRSKFLRTMEGKPTGEVTLVAVSGNPDSIKLADELNSLLSEAGWQTERLDAVFRSKPVGLSFVVHSQESMPESAVALSIGLAVIDLMQMPARVQLNPRREPGYLGIIVGSPAS